MTCHSSKGRDGTQIAFRDSQGSTDFGHNNKYLLPKGEIMQDYIEDVLESQDIDFEDDDFLDEWAEV